MDVDLARLSDETFLEHANWAQEHGIWDGREVTVENFSEFSEAIESKIEFFIRSGCLPDPELYKLTAQFALAGADLEEHPEILADIQEMGLKPEGTLIQKAGFGKDLSKFWKKHKVKILVGVGVAAVVTAVAVIVITSGGATSGAAIAAGGAAIDELKAAKDKPSAAPPSPQKREQLPNIASVPSSIPAPAEISLQSPVISFTPPPPIFNEPIEHFRSSLPEPMLPKEYYPKPEKRDFFQTKIDKVPELLPENRFLFPQEDQKIDWLNKKSLDLGAPLLPPSINQKPKLNERNIPTYSSATFHPTKSWTQWTLECIGWNPDYETPTPPDASMTFRIEGKVDPSWRIFGINGIGTSLEEAIAHAEHLAKFSNGHAIDWVYNRSHGAAVDLVEAGAMNMHGASPVTSKQIEKNLLEFHMQNIDNPKAKCLHFCHSQGAIHMKNALKNLPEEVRNRVIVVALAPAAIVPRYLCHQSYNYRIKGDPVPQAEMFVRGFFDSNEIIPSEKVKETVSDYLEMIVLEPHPDSPFFPHSFQNPTFYKVYKEQIENYNKIKEEY